MTGACTSAQLRNLMLANQLQEVGRAVAVLLPRLPKPAAATLRYDQLIPSHHRWLLLSLEVSNPVVIASFTLARLPSNYPLADVCMLTHLA